MLRSLSRACRAFREIPACPPRLQQYRAREDLWIQLFNHSENGFAPCPSETRPFRPARGFAGLQILG